MTPSQIDRFRQQASEAEDNPLALSMLMCLEEVERLRNVVAEIHSVTGRGDHTPEMNASCAIDSFLSLKEAYAASEKLIQDTALFLCELSTSIRVSSHLIVQDIADKIDTIIGSLNGDAFLQEEKNIIQSEGVVASDSGDMGLVLMRFSLYEDALIYLPLALFGTGNGPPKGAKFILQVVLKPDQTVFLRLIPVAVPSKSEVLAKMLTSLDDRDFEAVDAMTKDHGKLSSPKR